MYDAETNLIAVKLTTGLQTLKRMQMLRGLMLFTGAASQRTPKVLSRLQNWLKNANAKQTLVNNMLVFLLQLLATVLSQSTKAKEHLLEQSKSLEHSTGRVAHTSAPCASLPLPSTFRSPSRPLRRQPYTLRAAGDFFFPTLFFSLGGHSARVLWRRISTGGHPRTYIYMRLPLCFCVPCSQRRRHAPRARQAVRTTSRHTGRRRRRPRRRGRCHARRR